jgi:uncharacterized membrane protein YfcA
MDMTFYFLIIFLTVLFFSALVHGSIGFGFPMIATPLLALFSDIQTAIMLTLIPTVLVNLVSIKSEEKLSVVFKEFFPFALIAMLGSACGTAVLIYANSDYFKLLLALTILIYLLMDKLKINSTFVQRKPKQALGMFGISAGFLGGLTNVMAPVLIIYALESKYTKSQTIQFSNLCFLLGKLIQLFIFGLFGSFSLQAVGVSLSSLLIVGFALYVGIAIKKRIDAKAYIVFIKLLLLVISLILLYQVLGK